ncbi:hypothetical protein [Cohnella hongkongensis]|uniref:YfjL-like N-terminal domain-containing protein n=1 Tax=Cohnella hongkongensis TaxID=178337 RepID=A0ABV9FBN9_9BACL
MKKLVLAAVALVLIGAGFYVYTEIEGYPWKRAQIKKDAVRYMQEKYGMDARVTKSSFNFKFDTYMAKVYDVRDEERRTIQVERLPYRNEEGGGRGERLEDNYAVVYWERRTEERLREAFPQIYEYEGLRKIAVTSVHETFPLGEGVGPEKDESGVAIPRQPGHSASWNIGLVSEDIPEPFLELLLDAVRRMKELDLEVELFVTTLPRKAEAENRQERTKYIQLEHEDLGRIHGVEDLREAIQEF